MADVKGPPPLSRRARAMETRRRMTRAAHRLFVERGYSGATMADIADAAGVAVQTLYFTFHNKSELLQACYEGAVLGEDDPRPPPEQPWWADLMRARTASQALRHFVRGNTEIVARVGELDDVVRSALHEPDAIAVRLHNEELRRGGYHVIVEHISSRFGLARGLDVDSATDVLLALCGPALYRLLVLEYGWSRDRFERWLHRALVHQLLG